MCQQICTRLRTVKCFNKVTLVQDRVSAVLGILATAAFAQEASGPFGIHRGMTTEEVLTQLHHFQLAAQGDMVSLQLGGDIILEHLQMLI